VKQQDRKFTKQKYDELQTLFLCSFYHKNFQKFPNDEEQTMTNNRYK
jgi:hypothetical protein